MSEPVLRNRPIRQPDQRGFAEAMKLLVFVLGLAAPFILYVHLSSVQIEDDYRLSRLVEQRKQLQRENEKLRLIRSSLLSPAHVVQVAKKDLGMIEDPPGRLSVDAPPPREEGAGESKQPAGSSVAAPVLSPGRTSR